MSVMHDFGHLVGDRRPRVGTLVKIPSAVTFEIVSRTALDIVIVDLEHSPIGLEWLQTACAIAQGRGTSVLVRMPDASGREVQRVLDLGVDGIVVPQITTVSEAANVVDAATFPPNGRRGVGFTSRAGFWGTHRLRKYRDAGDQQTARCLQFETPESFAVMDELLSVPGLNAVLLGSADLSVTPGVAPTDPVLRNLPERLVSSARDHGIISGTAVRDASEVKNALALGFQFVVVGSDLTTCATALGQLAAEAVTGVATMRPRLQSRALRPGSSRAVPRGGYTFTHDQLCRHPVHRRVPRLPISSLMSSSRNTQSGRPPTPGEGQTPSEGTVQSVRSQLRESIIRGDLRPGEAVTSVQVAERFGVSRTPAREALRMLQEEGYLRGEPYQRLRVVELSGEELEAVFAERILLTVVCTRITVAKLTDDDITRMKSLLDDMHRARANEDHDAWRTADIAFHGMHLKGASVTMRADLARLYERAAMFRAMWLRHRDQALSFSMDDHPVILDACQRRDVEAGGLAAARHLTRVALTLLAELAPEWEPSAIRHALALAGKPGPGEQSSTPISPKPGRKRRK